MIGRCHPDIWCSPPSACTVEEPGRCIRWKVFITTASMPQRSTSSLSTPRTTPSVASGRKAGSWTSPRGSCKEVFVGLTNYLNELLTGLQMNIDPYSNTILILLQKRLHNFAPYFVLLRCRIDCAHLLFIPFPIRRHDYLRKNIWGSPLTGETLYCNCSCSGP